MNRFREFLFRVRSLFRKSADEAAMAEEIRTHLEMQTEANIAVGMTPAEARYAARREFGGVAQVQERWRDERTIVWLEQGAKDFRNAMRSLARTPGFTVVAVLTLALGLTVNAVVFTFANDFFLRPLPARDPERLVIFSLTAPSFQFSIPFSYPDFGDIRRSLAGGAGAPPPGAAFSDLMGYKEERVHLATAGERPVRTWVHAVSENYFDVLGVRAAVGRVFLPGEGVRPGADPIIVLTHDTWQGRFGADPKIVGRQLKLNGVAFTVVGVMPPGFWGASWGTALAGFVPASMLPQLSPARGWMIFSRGDTGFFVMGRLQSGATLEQARAATTVAVARLVADYPAYHIPGLQAKVMPESRSRPSPYVASYVPAVVGGLMTLALLVLVVAAANVANLLYARSANRERELAIRGALGASRRRLLWQVLVESLVLAVAAGVVGAVVVAFLGPLLMNQVAASDNIPPAAGTGLDWRLFVFTFGAAGAAGIVAGLLPSLKASRVSVISVLKGGTPPGGRARHPLRSLLVVGQVAVSVVVLVGAGLAVRSLQQLSRADLGFRPENLWLASFDLGMQRYGAEEVRSFQARLLEKARALPGVRSASIAGAVPFDSSEGWKGGVIPEGRHWEENTRYQMIPCIAVESAYLSTAGIPVVEGRDLSARDDATAPRVAVISRVLAEYFWPGESALGKRLAIQQDVAEVVGIVGEVRYAAMTERARPVIFQSLAQNERLGLSLLVRTSGETGAIAGAIRQVVGELDPALPLSSIRSMEQQIAGSPLAAMPLRLGAAVAAVQGGIALLLALLGVYGVVSFAVARRTREIGIRMALGARVDEVVRLVIRGGLRFVALGVVLGLLAAWAVTRYLAGVLYGVSPTDVTVFVGVPVLVFGFAVIACWWPARRAARIDPAETLRAE